MTPKSNLELSAEKLDTFIREAGSDLPDGVRLINGSELKPTPISWLWPGWLAKGKFHILAGAPGQGKTTIAMAMAATTTLGGSFPDGSRCDAGNVVVWSGEDDPADGLLPKLIAAGADISRVFFVGDVRIEGETVPFDPSRDMGHLMSEIERIGGVSLLVVDPVVTAVAGDSHKNTEVRRGLQPLVDLATHTGAAVLGISHFSKGGQGQDPAQRVVGSIAFSAVARIVLVAAKVKGEDGEDKRILARSKSNIGPDDGGFQYHLAQVEALQGIEASRVEWGESVSGTARDLFTDPAETDDETSARDDAQEFLIEVLADSPVPAKKVKAEASDAGHTWATVRRAADGLSVIKKKGGMNDGWYWSLPKMLTKNPKMFNVGECAPSNSSSTFRPDEEML
jgi:putative DNA primase/helicase